MRVAAVGAVLLMMGSFVLAAPAVEREDPVSAEIGRLREEINLLNLFNGLNLKQEQLGKLRDYAVEAEKLRESYFNSASMTVGEALAAFRELRGVLAENEGLPKDVEARAAQANLRLKGLEERYRADVRSLESRAASVLTAAQQVVLEEFKPCLIPPRNLKDPVRAGQAANRERGVEMLSKLRSLPEPVYESQIDNVAEKRLEIYEKHKGKLSEKESAASIRRLKAVAARARKMDDTQFEVEKEKLAEELHFTDELETLLKKVDKVRVDKFGGPGKSGRFLLSPAAISIYEERLGRAGSVQASAAYRMGERGRRR